MAPIGTFCVAEHVETDIGSHPAWGHVRKDGVRSPRRVDYSSSNIINRGNGWRDLWAHYILE